MMHGKKEKGKNVDLYSAYHVLHTSNALSSLNWAARPIKPQTTACKHRLSAVAQPLAMAASSSQVSTFRNPSLMGYYSFNRPRRDGRLSWPCWLTDSGRLTHKVVTRPAISHFSLAQDRESSPARTGGLTTMLRHQLWQWQCMAMPSVMVALPCIIDAKLLWQQLPWQQGSVGGQFKWHH